MIPDSDMLAMARALPIPVPWDRNEFIANMARQRGRPITLIPHNTAVPFGSMCGLWLARTDDDVIVYHADTSGYHIDHIVRHEVAHMVLGHCRTEDLDTTAAQHVCRDLLPDLNPTKVVSVLGRQNYDSPQEHAAEKLACMIMIAAGEAAERTSMFRSVFFRRH